MGADIRLIHEEIVGSEQWNEGYYIRTKGGNPVFMRMLPEAYEHNNEKVRINTQRLLERLSVLIASEHVRDCYVPSWLRFVAKAIEYADPEGFITVRADY